MQRKDFLKTLGATGVGMSVNWTEPFANLKLVDDDTPPSCVLIPSETAGPFPLDLTENNFFFRQDVREDEEGVPLKVKMKILGDDNCGPMPNVRVNIWHCSKDGLYSGYNTGGNPGQSGETYLRGYQYADANGEVEFTTILPGWYNGRICHIHFQVYVSSTYAAISQLTFPIDTKNDIYAANSDLYTKGDDPLNFNTDNIFSDGVEFQLATLTPAEDGEGYESYLEVTIQGTGTTATSNIEKETAKVMKLGQNYPNPYIDQTTIPLTMVQSSYVSVNLWDLSGKMVATLMNEEYLSSGEHAIQVNPSTYDISGASYVYEVIARNSNGIFKTSKMMTVMNGNN